MIKTNKIKKCKIIISMLVVLLSLSSCLPYIKIPKVENKIDVKFQATAGRDIIVALKEQNVEKLSNVFCKKVANTKYLNDNINYVFEYINLNGGLMIPDGKWKFDGSSHGAYSGGREVVDYGGWDYNKEVFIGNKKYRLVCNSYFTLIGHKDYEGITHINFVETIENSIENDDFLKKLNNALNSSGSQPIKYLGMGIFNFNYETFLDENVAPKEIYENEEYRFSFDELEKGHSKW